MRRGIDFNEKQSFFFQDRDKVFFFQTHFELFTTQRTNVFIKEYQSKSPFYPTFRRI